MTIYLDNIIFTIMNYEETLDYLFTSAPLFQNIGKEAYKEGLYTTNKLDTFFGHPHRSFKTIHVAGTNGKGSCSHTIAAILQKAGYKTGLFTSPHLVDFRERIRVDGKPISKEYVVDFVERYRDTFEPMHPSFFELTTAMAFNYFKQERVDVAVIEVGLGGRLDCTNIITPDLSVITNISFDHTQFLGDTLAKIAYEKAGIMKEGIPVVIGETTSETKEVFITHANLVKSPIIFAEEEKRVISADIDNSGKRVYQTKELGTVIGELGGLCQLKNTNTILSAIAVLQKKDYKLSEEDIKFGFANVCELTGLMGRWQKIGDNPKIICDTGHNIGGISYIVEQLKHEKYDNLHIVIGMVNDKDIRGVLNILPKDAKYYFTKASVKRALHETEIKKLAEQAGLHGNSYSDVHTALNAAKEAAKETDMIYIGGSSFIVADLLKIHD
jgi:dihydrofolate synthase / folylpolyglutamate synthase